MLGPEKMVAFVPTRNPKKVRPFYENVLGLRFASADQFATVFDANGTMLRVTNVPELKPQPFTILGWKVSNIEEVALALQHRGVHFEIYGGMEQDKLGIWRSPSGAEVAWFKDPDGNVLSVTQFS